jgi:hypothetical protein
MKKAKRESKPDRWSKAKLKALIEEAIVDAYGDDEQRVGFFTMIEDNVKFPFEVTLFGSQVTVEGVDMSSGDEIVAVCVRGRERRTLPILDLPFPNPPPKGAEWIEAYRLWVNPESL